MKLSSSDLSFWEEKAIEAARQAGAIIKREASKEVEVLSKVGGDTLASQVVTEVDLMAQEAILAVLRPLCLQFDIGILTEESEDRGERFKKEYFWSIDPLDGTLPFIEQTSGYAVSIALVSKEGEPIIGVVFDPVEDTIYHAMLGQGAFRNGEAWQLQQKGEFLTLICDRSFKKHHHFQRIIEELTKYALDQGLSDLKILSHGGAAMNALWALELGPACYFKFPKPHNGGGSLWDYSATACIYNEVGAFVSDIFGEPLDLNRADSTFMNHKGVIYSTYRELKEAIQTIYKYFA